MLRRSQCIKQATSLEEQTGRTDWTSKTGRTIHENWLCLGCSPISQLEMPYRHAGTVRDRPETTRTKLLTNATCCLAATLGDIRGKHKLANIRNDSTAEDNENTHTPQQKRRNDVESQTLSLKETSHQNLEALRNSSEKMKLLENQYSASITPGTVKTKPKKRLAKSHLKCNRDDSICPLTTTTSPLFGKRLWELRQGRALLVSLLHRSSWKLYLPLDFLNYLIIQPISLIVHLAQYKNLAHKVSIERRDLWRNGYGSWF